MKIEKICHTKNDHKKSTMSLFMRFIFFSLSLQVFRKITGRAQIVTKKDGQCPKVV
jgi:hypothetical protein